jgi:predicted nucleic acid-binding protein
MILVDTSVWIDYFNGQKTPETTILDQILGVEEILMGDIILAEVLQGFRNDQDFEAALNALSKFKQASMLNPNLAIRSAKNYRQLRKAGITVRKTVDCLIATFCIENRVELLHSDRDFDPFEQQLGLQVRHA